MIRPCQSPNNKLIKPAMAFDYKTRSPYYTTMTNAAGTPVNDRLGKIVKHFNHQDTCSSSPSISNKKKQQQQQDKQQQLQQQQTPNGFLLRLMAIDEKHEKKRQQQQQQQVKDRKDSTTEKRQELKDNATWKLEQQQQRGMRYNLDDSRRDRWISGQVLDDNQDRRLSLGVLDKQNDDSNSRLPFVIDSQRTTSPAGSEVPLPPLVPKDDVVSQSGRLSSLLADDFINNEDKKQIISVKKRPLRLPPLLLPPVYSVRPRPLKQRDFLAPTRVRGPVTESEWEDLIHCRYIRHNPSRFALDPSPSQSPFHW